MLKLVRLALTAAVLTAIAVRVRRRSRIPAHRPEPAAPRAAAGRRMALVWAAIAGLVAVTLAAALVPTQQREAAAARWKATPTPVPMPTPVPTPAAVTTWPPAELPGPGCSPAPRPVAVRPVDPRVRRAVDRQWRRIERWLKANAPRTYRTLGGPGGAHPIAVAESQMGVDFPDDLRASLLRHHGGGAVFGLSRHGAVALTVRQIRDSWRRLCSRDRSDPGSDPATGYGDGRMIPFLSFRGRDSARLEYAVVDSAGGAVGWDDPVSGTGMAPRLPSTYALLRAVADALERGGDVDGRRPAVRRGVLLWDDAREGRRLTAATSSAAPACRRAAPSAAGSAACGSAGRASPRRSPRPARTRRAASAPPRASPSTPRRRR